MLRTNLIVILLLICGAAYGGDGNFEINQACRNDGCFPGDSPGGAFEITESGSYVLTSDITVNVNTNAIEVEADDVTLDLNGFTVSGPVLCSGSPASCNQSGIGTGINADGQENFTLRNGTVRGMGNNGIVATGSGSRIENVSAIENAGIGLSLGPGTKGSIGRNVRAMRNGDTGVAGGYIIDSAAIDNNNFGIALGFCSNSIMSGNGSGSSCTAILSNRCDDSTDCD